MRRSCPTRLLPQEHAAFGQTPTGDLVVCRRFDNPLGTHQRLRFLLIVTQPLAEKGLSQLDFATCDLVFDR